MCNYCGNKEHVPRMDFRPLNGRDATATTVEELIASGVVVSPHAVLSNFKSVDAVRQYMEGMGYEFVESMLD